jgi:hypothetical protein
MLVVTFTRSNWIVTEMVAAANGEAVIGMTAKAAAAAMEAIDNRLLLFPISSSYEVQSQLKAQSNMQPQNCQDRSTWPPNFQPSPPYVMACIFQGDNPVIARESVTYTFETIDH